MTGLIRWFVHNPVAANLMMLLIVVGGLIATTTVQREVFPRIPSGRISVEMLYPGAAPEEVEVAVVVRIEEALRSLEGIKGIRSTANEGAASVILEFDLQTDFSRAIEEVRGRVEAITTFPQETERPVVRELAARSQVIEIAVAGTADRSALRAVAERMRNELAALSQIRQVELIGMPPREIAIEVSEIALRRHGLTLGQIAEAVRHASLDMQGGSIQTDRGAILLRTVGQAYVGADYENLTLLSEGDGSRLRLGDVATVADGPVEADQYARFDRNPAVMVSIFGEGEQNVLEIAKAVRGYVAQARSWLPEGVAATVWQDRSKELQAQLSLMVSNGVSGLALVFILLALFLELRLALWVSLGIPISFLGALAVMPGLGVSVSVISLFAFILVLGIVVDDAIIVGENVYRCQVESEDGVRGAVEGTCEIAKPVVFAVLTSIAAFLPLLFVPGMMGSVFRHIPLVVIPCLVFSLVESLGILPAHLSHYRRRAPGPWRRFQQRLSEALDLWCQEIYLPFLGFALRWRYLTVAVGISLLMLTGAMVVGGHAPVRFIPSMEQDFMVASVRMPQGAPVSEVMRVVARLEEGASRLRARVSRETGVDHLRHTSSAVGSQPMRAWALGVMPGVTSGPNLGEVTVELAPAEERMHNSERLAAMWREMAGPIPEAAAVEFGMSTMNPGADIDVQLAGPDVERLRGAAEAVKRGLREHVGVFEIADSFHAAQSEVKLGIEPAAETLGLTLQEVARQIRQGFYGEEAQRIQRGRDDIRVMVRYPRSERRSLGDLENIRIRAPSGGEIPLSQVARAEFGRTPTSITRVNRNRAVNVTAAVDPAVISAAAVVDDLRTRILPKVLADYPGVIYIFEGFQAEQSDAVDGLQRGLILSLIAIFGLLAIPLKSYGQPLVIMAAIPFGMVGAVWGHILLGLDLTLMSAFGLVALAGVVVNDGLVMVDCINRSGKRQGASGRRRFPISAVSMNAVREAGARRFRPILLTSLTTFVGLAPLMLEESAQAMFLIPMAVSLAFGVLFATCITLILVPISCRILFDFRLAGRWIFWGRGSISDSRGSQLGR